MPKVYSGSLAYNKAVRFKRDKEIVEDMIRDQVPKTIGKLMGTCTIGYIAQKCKKSQAYINSIKSGRNKCSVDGFIKLKELEKLEC